MVHRRLLKGFQIMNEIEPGTCPNFYLWGESVSKLEADAKELTAMMEMDKVIPFQGAVKSFSIFMPYYENAGKAEQFMYHLRESYSIARDCYDRYQGILIVECSEEWSKFGYNPCLEQFLHFIREHREVLFGEFSKNQLWIRQKCETMKIQECMTLFCEDAERSGYSVTEEAKQKLSGLLETRNEMQLDNETLVLQLIRQIQLDKLMQPETEKQIGEEDIRTVSGLPEKEMPRKEIGFRAEIG